MLSCALVCVCALLPRSRPKPGNRTRWRSSIKAHSSICRFQARPAVGGSAAEGSVRFVDRRSVGDRARFQGQYLHRRRQPGRIAGEAILDRSQGDARPRETAGGDGRNRGAGDRHRPAGSRVRGHIAGRKSVSGGRSGKADVFYDPKTKYIWALAFAKNGDLYVATGDRGEIHRVTPAGVGSVFFRTEEAHARSMTWMRRTT